MARSKIYRVNGRNVSYEFNSNGQMVGVLDHSDPTNPTPVNPQSNLFTSLISDRDAVFAHNINRYGGDKDAYTNTVTQPTLEEQVSFFNLGSKAGDNTENNIEETIYPNIDDGVANPSLATQPSAFAAYKSTRTSPGTDFFTYPLDIDPMQDHLKISKYTYRRNEDEEELGSAGVQGSRPKSVETKTIRNSLGEQFGNLFKSKEDQVKPVVLERTRKEGDSMLGSQLQGSILLPMPKVVDTNGCEWGESEVNIFGLAALGGIEAGKKIFGGKTLGFLGSGFGNTNKLLETDALSGVDKKDLKAVQQITTESNRGANLARNFKQGGSALLNAAAAEATARVTGQSISQDQILARTSGRVLNPNAELLFQGPVLRDFNFDFLMIARSQQEGKEIRKIIRWFKSGMAPKFNSATFLKTPDVFTLEYKNGVGDGDILKTVNRFSPGGLALRTIAVDYAPSGYWSAYQDSQPVALKMSLNFAELRPIYSQDQNDESLFDTVGY